MPSLDDLKKRIKSVKSTQKITKAMKMVAAAKLRKAQENAEKGRPYSKKMESIILNLTESISDPLNAPKLLVGTGNDKTYLCVVLTADRGLCGGFNSNICKLAKVNFKKILEEGKDLKIIGDNLLSKEISKYLEKATSVKVISEENFELISKELYINSIFWLLDPIDGSANLNRNLDHSYISVCLISNEGFPLISVIGSIKDKKIRSCIVENKVIFNDSFKIKNHDIALNSLYLVSGFPLNFEKKDLYDYIYKLSLFKKVRMYGSAVGSLLMVADKKIDVYYEKGIFSWDVAGALLNVLLKED